MGKLADLLSEYKKCPSHSPREPEIIAEIYKIVDWMKENGYMSKPFKLPKKSNWSGYGVPFKVIKSKESGHYCGHCEKKLPELKRDVNNCIHCGWGIGYVYLVYGAKDLNTTIKRV